MRRRAQLQNRIKQGKVNMGNERGLSILGYWISYHVYKPRRWGPFYWLWHGLTVTFALLWLIFSIKTQIGMTDIVLEQGILGSIMIPEDKGLYQFQVEQIFEGKTPLYSELEIEIVNDKMEHVYSFYKDLWQERHSNGEGGTSVYKDLKMTFEIQLPKKGQYYIRAIPYNDNEGQVIIEVYQRIAGNIYFGYLAIFFLIISILLLFGANGWGTPEEMWREMKERKTYKNNPQFRKACIVSGLFIVGILIINITNYGYAKAGEENRTPTWFYRTGSVYYLG
jgi:hypothetical protein